MAVYLKEISSADFKKEVMESDMPVVVDFFSNECPPCEALAPKLESIADKFNSNVKFVKIFRQNNRDLAASLGVSSSPTLLFFKNGKEISGRLTGGIKKKNILEHMELLLDKETFLKLNIYPPRISRNVDVIILGGGPAGLSAALYASQAKLATVVVDQAMPGGQVASTHMISNYPGTGKAVHGYELMHYMAEQAKEAGAELISAIDVTDITLSDNGSNHRLVIDDELELYAPALILATGAEPRLLNAPGETVFKGKGISYCATCDGKYYGDKEIIVIGGGNSAVEESIFLTRFASKITVVHQFDFLQANKTSQKTLLENPKVSVIWNSEPRKFEKTSDGKMQVTLENIKTKNFSNIQADGVFIFIGMAPNNKIIPDSIHTNQWGYVTTSDLMETNISGVFAVGDIREKNIRQAITAASDGAIAAIAAERYIESLRVPKTETRNDRVV
jgi:thioredoxin reductase (NADPH)